MFTVCSKCNLRLTVTATDLRAAQGYVRCGRCHNVFNALAALADDPARHLEAEGTAAATQSRPALTLPEPRQSGPVAADTAEQLAATDAALEFNPASTNINEVFIEAAPGEGTGTFESIVLSADEEAETTPAPQAPAAASPLPPDPDAELEVPRTREAWTEPPPAGQTPQADVTPGADPGFDVSPAAASEIVSAMEDAPAAAPAAAGAAAPAEEEAPPAALLGPDRPVSRRSRWALRCGAGALILCLIAQGVHHYRGELAQTSLLHRPLTALYAALGQPLDPRWDVSRYEIRQLGASTDGAAPGDLVVRASIMNRAPRDQPLPLLRVVMQDRFGNRVAARDLKPAEYLGSGAPQVSLMAPGQRVDIQVAFQDPGQAATGFEIDACLAARDRRVTCANDPGGR